MIQFVLEKVVMDFAEAGECVAYVDVVNWFGFVSL